MSLIEQLLDFNFDCIGTGYSSHHEAEPYMDTSQPENGCAARVHATAHGKLEEFCGIP